MSIDVLIHDNLSTSGDMLEMARELMTMHFGRKMKNP